MSGRSFLNKLGKRKGDASRSKGRIGSAKNKRAASKAVRQFGKHRRNK